jgi:competence protein ComFC
VLRQDEEHICSACAKKNYTLSRPKAYNGPFYTNALSAFVYDGDVRRALHRFKFHGALYMAEFFAGNMALKLSQTDWKIDLIVPVPSHFLRRRKKGYDHSRLLAQEISRITGVPMATVLRKTRRTKPMYGLRVSQRRANIMDSLVWTRELGDGEKTVLLIDDIITTGCTAAECVRLLRKSGAERVYALTAAGIK